MKRAEPRFDRKSQAVYDKWQNLKEKYKGIVDNNEKTGRSTKTWTYLVQHPLWRPHHEQFGDRDRSSASGELSAARSSPGEPARP